MRWLATSVVLISVGCAFLACGDDDAAGPGGGTSSGGTSSGGTSGSSGSSNGGTDPGSKSDGGVDKPGDLPLPTPTCEPPVKAADVTTPTTVVGANGSACDEAGLQAALDKGGIVTFSCGGTAAAPFEIKLTKELKIEEKEVVIDGGGTVTLSGNKATRILHLGRDDNFEKPTPKVTVQKLNFADGHTTDVAATGDTKMGGAAIYRLGGTLTVIDSKFVNNIGPVDGQDVAGGAIYSIGGTTTTIVGSSFSGNKCSNGGAVGNLGVAGQTIVNSSFTDNAATGKDANPGNGGNGGAISFDGPSQKSGVDIAWNICGTTFARNSGGVKALGGALFRTCDTVGNIAKKTAPVTIDRSTFDANESGGAGAIYMHQVDLTITASTFSNNVARAGNGGAIWAEGSDDGPADVQLNFTNLTVANNTAKEGLGGGFVMGGHITGGEWKHVTVASNAVTTDSGNQYLVFAAGIMGDVTKLKLTNSIFANNKKPAPAAGESANCQPGGFIDGGGNLEYSVNKDPKNCTAGITLADPLLSPLASGDGPTQTMALAAGSPAIGKGTSNCAATDQRGHARKTPCAAGAFEP